MSVDGLQDLLLKLARMPSEALRREVERREAATRAMRSTHFSMEAALSQIARFLTGSGAGTCRASDLACTALPSTLRDAAWGSGGGGGGVGGGGDSAVMVAGGERERERERRGRTRNFRKATSHLKVPTARAREQSHRRLGSCVP